MRRISRYRPNLRPITLVVLGTVLLFRLDGLSAASVEATAAVYRTAPNFARVDLDHRKVSLAAYRGKVVLLNFWATWCAPCLTEVPRFAEWQRRYGGRRGLQIVGVSMDDEEPPVRAAYQRYGLNYPVVMGDEKLGESYGGVLGLPLTFLIDRNGEIRFKHRGVTDLNILEREIQELLLGH
jgi:cytochrome c biogenesis protein CcmG, thiol:disulfide interchange protein DsbE